MTEAARLEADRFSFFIEVPVKRCFQSKAIHDVELAPYDDSRRLFFGLLDSELARKESESLALIRPEFGDDSHL